jgi:hypothetical protein
MPEGDTIARAAAVLHQALAGETVTGFVSELAPVAAVHDDHPVTGRTVDRAVAHGKHLVFVFSGGLLLRTHMRMHGSWHLYRPGERWQRAAAMCPARHRAGSVAFDVYDAELVPGTTRARIAAVATLGPTCSARRSTSPPWPRGSPLKGARDWRRAARSARGRRHRQRVPLGAALPAASIRARPRDAQLRSSAPVQRAVVLLRANARSAPGGA